MIVCSIDWCAFTWEAFTTLTGAAATLLAGGAAVYGAVKVGMRQLEVAEKQTEISGRQAEILAHQVEVERAKLRADMFEQRFAVYQACQTYLRDAMNVRRDPIKSDAIGNELAKQLELSRFLFSGQIRQELVAAAALADKLMEHSETLRDMRAAPNSLELSAQIAAVRDIRKSLREKLYTLADDMGEEMKLFIPRSPSSPSDP